MMYHHIQFYIGSWDQWPMDAEANCGATKVTQAPDNPVLFPEVYRDAVRGFFFQIRMALSEDGTYTAVLPVAPLKLQTFYTVETKLDFDNEVLEVWFGEDDDDTTLAHIEPLLDGWETSVGVLTMGASGGAGVRSSTYWLNNLAVSTEGWPAQPYNYVGGFD